MPVEKVVESFSPYYQSRKSSKPLMEKRRRARINSSLNELKNLILDTYKTDMNSSSNSKLEKADILEIAVKHVRSLQRQQMAAAVSTDPAALGRYRAGYSRCRAEVARFMGTANGVDPQVRQKLLNHLERADRSVHTGQQAQPIRLQVPDTTGHLTSQHGHQASPLPTVPASVYGGVPHGAAVILPGQTPISSQHLIPLYVNNMHVNIPAEHSPVHGLTHSPFGLTTENNQVVPVQQFVSAQTAISPAQIKSASPVNESEKMWRPW
ncbi:HES1 [Branchiostoma lanceolatum]|uniref:HES1 protein n=1 Tax=Branchiostoma lanceolatum TaxID=7740 RepID=A0A8J9VHF1_BRALA|nr:HES1 [Branchiostoma lanceolatum]CAH1239953.1 HES1 [Branchiostoma lanceolatum]